MRSSKAMAAACRTLWFAINNLLVAIFTCISLFAGLTLCEYFALGACVTVCALLFVLCPVLLPAWPFLLASFLVRVLVSLPVSLLVLALFLVSPRLVVLVLSLPAGLPLCDCLTLCAWLGP